MSLSVAELQPALHDLFGDTARDIAKDTKFCQRERLITGPVFAKTLVFGLLKNPDASLEALADFAADHLGVEFSPQSLDERFTPAAASLMLELFLEAFERSFASARAALLPVLRRFPGGVFVRDATSVRLPACLAGLFPGRAGRDGSAAALKVVLELEVASGQFTEACVLPGLDNEKSAALAAKPLPEGSLLLEDTGFYSGDRLQGYVSQGVYVLTRVPVTAAFFERQGERFGRIDLARWLRRLPEGGAERSVHVLHERKLELRLLAVRVPEAVAQARRERVRQEAKKRGRAVSRRKLELCDWNILLTNAPRALLGLGNAWQVRAVRWQIELLFKAFKSGGGVGHRRSEQPWRVLAELYAKLLGQVAQQWLLLAAGYVMLRHSARRAARHVRDRAGDFAEALGSAAGLARQLARLERRLRKRCRVQRRRVSPSTFDRLAELDVEFRLLDEGV